MLFICKSSFAHTRVDGLQQSMVWHNRGIPAKNQIFEKLKNYFPGKIGNFDCECYDLSGLKIIQLCCEQPKIQK